jgi:hypothetical protein
VEHNRAVAYALAPASSRSDPREYIYTFERAIVGAVLALADYADAMREASVISTCSRRKGSIRTSRRQWILNDEGLYNWARSSRVRI